MINEDELWCVVFVSIVVKESDPELVSGFIETIKAQRLSDNRTGLTIFSHGNLMVMIEGTRESVYKEFYDAKRHVGHHSPIKLYDGPIPFRFFEDSPLALKIIGPEQYKHLDDFQTPELQEYFEEFLSTAHIVPKIVADFVKNNM